MLQALVNFRASSSLEGDPRFDEMWTLVRSEALLSQRLVDLDHQVWASLHMGGLCRLCSLCMLLKAHAKGVYAVCWSPAQIMHNVPSSAEPAHGGLGPSGPARLAGPVKALANPSMSATDHGHSRGCQLHTYTMCLRSWT